MPQSAKTSLKQLATDRDNFSKLDGENQHFYEKTPLQHPDFFQKKECAIYF